MTIATSYKAQSESLVNDLKSERDRMVDKMLDYGVKNIDKTMSFNELIPRIYDKAFDMTDYTAISKIVREGKAQDKFNIGDEIPVKYTADGTEYDYPFRIVHFEDVELENGSVVPGMIVQAVYATHDEVEFDTSNYNRWAVSSGRTWLQDTFKSRLTPGFVDILKPVKIETLRNYADSDTKGAGATGRIYDITYDVFFPATTTNIGLQTGDDYDPTYGVGWSYWSSVSTGDAWITRDVTDRRTARSVYLRSAVRSNAYNEFVASTSGSRNSSYANTMRRFAPACVIC